MLDFQLPQRRQFIQSVATLNVGEKTVGYYLAHLWAILTDSRTVPIPRKQNTAVSLDLGRLTWKRIKPHIYFERGEWFARMPEEFDQYNIEHQLAEREALSLVYQLNQTRGTV